jgi:putative phosphoesterase
MKVGVVSDVHNNVRALAYALEHLADCECVLNLGDLVFEYRVETEIVEIARRAGLIGIVGNHEKAILLHPASSVRNKLAADVLDYLKALPPSRTMAIGGFDLLVAHGAPWDDPDDYRCAYVYERNNAAMERMRSVAADIILLGHTHIPMLAPIGDKLVINPGSCGDARGAQDRLTFGKIDFDERVATVYGVREGEAPDRLLERGFYVARLGAASPHCHRRA